MIADSARKHGVSAEDVIHAMRNTLVSLLTDVEDRVIVVGPGRDGRLLEVVVLDRPGQEVLVIHAMACRPKFLRYLER
ncbi:MAG: hypothetical protein ABIW46_01640 [Acidimicrobiales bacterium]